jgi:hypothetical protein
MNQKVLPSGNILKTSNTTKALLIERWRQNDNIFLTAIFSPLSPNNLNIVNPLCLYILEELFTPIVSRQNNMIINRSILMEVNGPTGLDTAGMNSILQLFRNRNDNIVSRELNSAFKPSKFMNATSLTTIMDHNISEHFNFRLMDDQINNLHVDKIYRMYFPYRQANMQWVMVILDFNLSLIYYVDPGNQSADPDFLDFIDKVEVQFNYFISELWNASGKINDVDWEVAAYPLNGSICAEDISGIFIAIVLYFIVQECPVYIPVNQLTNMKPKIALWLIEGSLPM